MVRFHSYRSKLQFAFVVLGVTAIGITGWQASEGAASALRRATFDRLTAIRETKRRQIERYFEEAANHVLALSSDESAISALESFGQTWRALPAAPQTAVPALRKHYDSLFGGAAVAAQWYPIDRWTVSLQWPFIASNPHAAREMLLAPAGMGRFGEAHARYHPTFARYRSAFGFYDILLFDTNSRVVYSVLKEIDIGWRFSDPPFNGTRLARAFRRAISLTEPEQFVIEDYAPYPPSNFAPAAFLAAPVWRAGEKAGVLAIQVSIEEVNRVMTGDRKWREQGLGETGQAYIVGRDGILRSDLRFEIGDASLPPEVMERVRRDRTAILNVPLSLETAAAIRRNERATETGVDLRDVPVLRAHTRLDIPGLQWMLLAEIAASEAFAPVRELRLRILNFGLGIAGLFFAAAWYLARSVTRPVLALAEGARRLGTGDFKARLPVPGKDEVGQLAESFNRMVDDLERTTVSRDELIEVEKQLRILTARLLTAQEEERQRLARELHDDLTQRLAAVAIEAGRVAREPVDGESDWRGRVDRIRERLARISDDVHGLSRRLHPAVLDELGLEAAVESECRSFFELGGAPVKFEADGDLVSLSKDVKMALYRIVQEGLHNIRRHAAAGEVRIRLRRGASAVELEIEDNGRGFDRSQPGWRPGLGLASMGERARFLGGAVVADSNPGKGTRIGIRLPLEGHHDQAVDSARG